MVIQKHDLTPRAVATHVLVYVVEERRDGQPWYMTVPIRFVERADMNGRVTAYWADGTATTDLLSVVDAELTRRAQTNGLGVGEVKLMTRSECAALLAEHRYVVPTRSHALSMQGLEAISDLSGGDWVGLPLAIPANRARRFLEAYAGTDDPPQIERLEEHTQFLIGFRDYLFEIVANCIAHGMGEDDDGDEDEFVGV